MVLFGSHIIAAIHEPKGEIPFYGNVVVLLCHGTDLKIKVR